MSSRNTQEQLNHHNICWQCTLLQTTNILKLYIPLCCNITFLFILKFQFMLRLHHAYAVFGSRHKNNCYCLEKIMFRPKTTILVAQARLEMSWTPVRNTCFLSPQTWLEIVCSGLALIHAETQSLAVVTGLAASSPVMCTKE